METIEELKEALIEMIDEGKFTFYIDLVDKKYYKSSLESESLGFSFDPEKDSIIEMFQNIRDNT